MWIPSRAVASRTRCQFPTQLPCWWPSIRWHPRASLLSVAHHVETVVHPMVITIFAKGPHCRGTQDLDHLLATELKDKLGAARTRTIIVLSAAKETVRIPVATD